MSGSFSLQTLSFGISMNPLPNKYFVPDSVDRKCPNEHKDHFETRRWKWKVHVRIFLLYVWTSPGWYQALPSCLSKRRTIQRICDQSRHTQTDCFHFSLSLDFFFIIIVFIPGCDSKFGPMSQFETAKVLRSPGANESVPIQGMKEGTTHFRMGKCLFACCSF